MTKIWVSYNFAIHLVLKHLFYFNYQPVPYMKLINMFSFLSLNDICIAIVVAMVVVDGHLTVDFGLLRYGLFFFCFLLQQIK